LAFSTTCSGPTSNATSSSDTNIRLGLSVEQFRQVVPQAYQDAGNADRYIVADTLFGVDGRWTYYFNAGQLRWYIFNAYEAQISKNRFDQFLRSTNAIMANYDRDLGKARKVRRGITTFNDPSVQNHNGYLVEQATWEVLGEKRTVEFSFLGDHRSYALLLSIHVGQ
jgi:hypothetical protein